MMNMRRKQARAAAKRQEANPSLFYLQAAGLFALLTLALALFRPA